MCTFAYTDVDTRINTYILHKHTHIHAHRLVFLGALEAEQA